MTSQQKENRFLKNVTARGPFCKNVGAVGGVSKKEFDKDVFPDWMKGTEGGVRTKLQG